MRYCETLSLIAVSLTASLSACNPRNFNHAAGVNVVNADTDLASVPHVAKATVMLVGYKNIAARYPGDVNGYRGFCTGTLVDRQTIVTAGHCVSFSFLSKPDKLFVLFDDKFSQTGDEKLAQIQNKMIEISLQNDISVHPQAMNPMGFRSILTGFNMANKVRSKEKDLGRRLNEEEAVDLHKKLEIFDYDIAVIRLSKPAPEDFVPIPIASENDTFAEDGFSAGFGIRYWYLPGFAVQAQITELAKRGEAAQDTLAVTSGKRALLLDSKTLFVRHRNCDGVKCTMAPGDSGGPFYQQNSKGEWRLVGVLSGPCDLWNNHEADMIAPLSCTRYQYVPYSKKFIESSRAGR